MNSPPEVSVNVEGQIYGNVKSDSVRKSPQHQPGVVLLFGLGLYLACPSAPGEQTKVKTKGQMCFCIKTLKNCHSVSSRTGTKSNLSE